MRYASLVPCRTCSTYAYCQQRTISEREKNIYGADVVVIDGQCDGCLAQWGDDEYTKETA